MILRLSLTFCLNKLVKIEAHFLKKFALVTNKCLEKDVFRKRPRTTENFSKYTAVRQYLCGQILLLSRIFYRAILGSELYRLSRYIAPYKQSLS